MHFNFGLVANGNGFILHVLFISSKEVFSGNVMLNCM